MDFRTRYRAFTIVELVAVIVVVLIFIGVLLPVFSSHGHARGSRQIKDSTQIRGVNQGMVLWAQANKDVYPLPSMADNDGATVAGPAEEKDTTSNIMSIMVFAGYFSPELAVSPAESNGSIRVFDGYEYTEPHLAVDPKKALWDPALNADFTKGTGHISYSHLLPAGERRAKWSNTFRADEAVIGNRGPEIDAVAYGAKGDPREGTPHRAQARSNTDLIHGGRSTWEGNICYNDNHVEFETSMTPRGVVWADEKGVKYGDVLFHSEAKDPNKSDAFLGIFVKAGATPAEFRAIWD